MKGYMKKKNQKEIHSAPGYILINFMQQAIS